MHVTFVSLGMELLGVEYLSSYLKAHGHRTSLAHHPALFDDRFQLRIPALAKWFDQDDKIVEKILALDPDLVGFSCLTNVFGWALEIARRVKERKDIPIVFGGVHPSAVPEFVIEYPQIDYVCEGEGEVALLSLLESLDGDAPGADIPNIWRKRDGKAVPPPRVAGFLTDLDALPFPDKDLFADTIPRRHVYRMMTGRGCPYRCTFCFNNFFAHLPTERTTNKSYLRRRSVDSCIQELVEGKQRYDYKVIEFHDDIFTMDKDWLRAFLPRLRDEVGVPWICETHAKFMDDELAQLMKDCGCVGAKMGVQSLDRHEYKSKTLRRAEREQDIIKTFAAFKKAGLQLDVDHIFGLPDEAPEAKEYALEFYREHSPGRIACFFLTYFPGLEITQKAFERGDITQEQLDGIHRGEVLWYHQVHALTPEAAREMHVAKGYMIAFQLMPSIPKPLRRFVKPRLLAAVPGMVTVSRMVMATRMLVDWLFDGNFGAQIYLRLYLHHIFGRGRRLNDVDPRPGGGGTRELPSPRAAES